MVAVEIRQLTKADEPAVVAIFRRGFMECQHFLALPARPPHPTAPHSLSALGSGGDHLARPLC